MVGLYWLEFLDTIKFKLNATHRRYVCLVNVVKLTQRARDHALCVGHPDEDR